MKPPIFVRKLSTDERKGLEAGLRSKDTFTLRRCQTLLASSRGDEVPQIAENLGCGQQTVRDAIHDFNERGLKALSFPAHHVPKEPARPSMREALSACGSCCTAPQESLAGIREPVDATDGSTGGL
jgi:hypothetical protein